MESRLKSLMVAVRLAIAAVIVVAAIPPEARAHDGAHSNLLGAPAARGQGRPIMIHMNDYDFGVHKITVKVGETIRFVIVNNGKLLHEFNMNTAAENAAHRPMMVMMMRHGMITEEKVVNLKMKMPDGTTMTHVEPNAVLVEPGKSAEISWKFTRPGELEIGCNIPDHTEFGMVAALRVVRR